jgi:myosin heavy subunit
MEDLYADIGYFEKKLKYAGPMGQREEDSSDEDVPVSEMDIVKDKNRVLLEKLYKAQNTVKEYKDILDTIQNNDSKDIDFKDRKIIELTRKNRDLQVRVESVKNKAARAMEEVLKLRQGGDPNIEDTKSSVASEMADSTTQGDSDLESVAGLKRKIKKQDERIVKLRNDSQKYKTDYEKALKIIEREIGEGINIDEVLKGESNWKGRAQKIEMLKTKLKKLKLDYGESISTTTFQSEMTTTKSHAEKNLETMGTNRARELEKLKEELVETRDQLESIIQKYKGACARKTAVENEMKELKSLMANKVKILLDKAENDDKLINMLREENKLLKSGKAAKGGASKTIIKSDDTHEIIYNLQNDNSKLKNDIIVLRADAEKKQQKINDLMTN